MEGKGIRGSKKNVKKEQKILAAAITGHSDTVSPHQTWNAWVRCSVATGGEVAVNVHIPQQP